MTHAHTSWEQTENIQTHRPVFIPRSHFFSLGFGFVSSGAVPFHICVRAGSALCRVGLLLHQHPPISLPRSTDFDVYTSKQSEPEVTSKLGKFCVSDFRFNHVRFLSSNQNSHSKNVLKTSPNYICLTTQVNKSLS